MTVLLQDAYGITVFLPPEACTAISRTQNMPAAKDEKEKKKVTPGVFSKERIPAHLLFNENSFHRTDSGAANLVEYMRLVQRQTVYEGQSRRP